MKEFTPAQKAHIVAARKNGESWYNIALRFRADQRRIKAVVADVEAHPERLTPAPYATGYRTGVRRVHDVFGGVRPRSILWRPE